MLMTSNGGRNGTSAHARKHRPARLLAGAAGAFALGWGGYAAATWLRYGHHRRNGGAGKGESILIDTFIPEYEVGDRHEIRVAAPAEFALEALKETDLESIPLVHAIFKARALILGTEADASELPRGLLTSTLAMGWGVLAEVPGREIVVGAVTKPWEADVTFHALEPETFRGFNEPGWVKIVWTLEAEPIGPEASIARTRVRVRTTDARARAKFRRYWSVFSPGIRLVRRLSLPVVKAAAERRFLESSPV
ncbi:MAG TPA: hypothetical protein VF092_04460 [Longimicrobium sp.]